MDAALKDTLSLLMAGEATPQPDGEDFPAAIERIRVTGRIHEITEEFSLYFLDLLPPKIHGGWWFAFADGQEPLTIFWTSAGKRYCRRLTEHETTRLCEASGQPQDYGFS
jgi:hypothetical protein